MVKKRCVKCNCNDIKVINALPIKINHIKMINPIYYICAECGYMELWINSDIDKKYLEKIH